MKQVSQDWNQIDDFHKNVPDKVIINQIRGKIVALSPILDYMYRSKELGDVTLYDWVRLYEKRPLSGLKKSQSDASKKKSQLQNKNSLDADANETDKMEIDEEIDLSDMQNEQDEEEMCYDRIFFSLLQGLIISFLLR